MVEILALVLQHDEDAVLTAGSMALEAGVATKTHILNLLHRLVDGKPISTEVASVKGYDWSIPFFCKIRVAGFMLLSAVGA